LHNLKYAAWYNLWNIIQIIINYCNLLLQRFLQSIFLWMSSLQPFFELFLHQITSNYILLLLLLSKPILFIFNKRVFNFFTIRHNPNLRDKAFDLSNQFYFDCTYKNTILYIYIYMINFIVILNAEYYFFFVF